MSVLKNLFENVVAGRKLSARNRRESSQKHPRRLSLEAMESRTMMTANPLVAPIADFHSIAASVRVNSAASAFAAPAAPSLSATAASSSQINLGWTGVSGATGYLVDEWINSAWKQIASFGGGTTGAAVSGLSAGTTYYFDVASYNSSGTTWSNMATAATLKAAPPAAPSLSATAASASQINLAWSGGAGGASFLVDEWVNGAWKQIATVSSGTTSYAVGGLSAGTTYYFDVAAANSAGTTWSSDASATTPAAVAINHPVAATAYSPVSGSLFSANGPSYLDVEQGQVGDCWLLASLAEVAARDPQDIRNMFTADGTTVENGTTVNLYNVRFFNSAGVAEHVTVDTELPSGGGYYDQPQKGDLWVALAEKAYAQANGAGYVTTGTKGSDSYAALNGGDAAWALQAITGKSASDFAINPTNIAAAWNAGELVCLTSSTSPASQYIVGDSQSTHEYAVVNYTASSSQPIQIFNPWGTNAQGWAPGTFNGHQVYGLFSANASFVSQNFSAQTLGSGIAAGGDELHRYFEAATDLLMAGFDMRRG